MMYLNHIHSQHPLCPSYADPFLFSTGPSSIFCETLTQVSAGTLAETLPVATPQEKMSLPPLGSINCPKIFFYCISFI